MHALRKSINKGNQLNTGMEDKKMAYKTDIEIAQECKKKKITEVAETAGIDEKYLELYGNYKAKIDFSFLSDNADKKDGKLLRLSALPTDFARSARMPSLL